MSAQPLTNAVGILRVPVVGPSYAGRGESFGDEILSWRATSPVKGGKYNDQYFCTDVQGDSLINHNIHEGDYAIARIDRHAHIGDLVIAWTPGGRQIKYLMSHVDKTKIRLMSGNPRYRDQSLSRAEVKIIGVVCRIERDLIVDGREVIEIVREFGDSRKPYRFQYF